MGKVNIVIVKLKDTQLGTWAADTEQTKKPFFSQWVSFGILFQWTEW